MASSGRPPLPQMARTPWSRPSGSVKRTMRALVVVPMETFSYLPSASLRTPGAVWRRNAPVRSSGGSTPWSKMRICVRSRMPMTWPSTVTESPARSSRICSSDAGKLTRCSVTARLQEPRRGQTRTCRGQTPSCPRKSCPQGRSSCLPVVVDGAVGPDVSRGAARRPALVVDCDGVEGHMRVGVLDVALEHGHVAAEAHRTDARLVEELLELVLELRDERVGVARADRPRDRLLGEVHRVVGRAADPDADDPRRARLSRPAHRG